MRRGGPDPRSNQARATRRGPVERNARVPAVPARLTWSQRNPSRAFVDPGRPPPVAGSVAGSAESGKPTRARAAAHRWRARPRTPSPGGGSGAPARAPTPSRPASAPSERGARSGGTAWWRWPRTRSSGAERAVRRDDLAVAISNRRVLEAPCTKSVATTTLANEILVVADGRRPRSRGARRACTVGAVGTRGRRESPAPGGRTVTVIAPASDAPWLKSAKPDDKIEVRGRITWIQPDRMALHETTLASATAPKPDAK
jgi:hypothetical protein